MFQRHMVFAPAEPGGTVQAAAQRTAFADAQGIGEPAGFAVPQHAGDLGGACEPGPVAHSCGHDGLRSRNGRVPQREPALQVGLGGQVAGQRRAGPELEGVVAVAVTERREGIERPAFISVSARLAAAPWAGRKHTAPAPVGRTSSAACAVQAADGIAKSTSRFGGAGGVRPSRTSRKPTALTPRARWPAGRAGRAAAREWGGWTAAPAGPRPRRAPAPRRRR